MTRDALFTLVVLAMCIGLGFLDLLDTPSNNIGFHARARVLDVDNSRVRTNVIIKTEAQILSVVILNGSHQGQRLTVDNMLTGKLEFDEFYAVGDVILLEYDITDGQASYGLARGHYRLHLQMTLVGLYGLLLLLVGGFTGVKALLTFVFAAMVLWKVFFPLLLKGMPPLPTGLLVTALMIGVIAFSVGGLNRRGTATFVGSMLGVLVTCGLAVVFTQAFSLHGAIRPFAESLLYAGFYDLSLRDIFIAGVFIASSGAVTDLAMDIAASMDEIRRHHPEIGLWEHLRSGMRVGQAVIGTMTTTLLLAYSCSHITMFLLFMAKGLPAANILNSPFISAEVLNILVGSFGLITVAPFTVLVSGLLYKK